MAKIADQLAKVSIFSECSRRELDVIAKAGKEVVHKEGAAIAREGEPGVGLFLILEGTADVRIGGVTKKKFGPGDFFGEIALLDGGPRTASVVATSQVKVFGITEWVFRGLLQQHPSIAMKTLQVMADRLRSASKQAV